MAAPIQVPVDFDYSSGKRTTDRVVRDLERTFERLGRSGRKNLRPLGEGLSAATANASEFDKSLAAANARVIAFGASAGLVVKVQQAFAALVKSTIDVEKSLKDINVILGATEKQLSQFGTGLFKVAKETGQTFETVAAAATELSRQGLSAEKTLQRTKDAMILARLAGMDAVSAVDALTATLNTFTDAGLNSTKVVNKLAKVDAAFAVSSQDLAQALQRVGASAKGAGVSFDELLAIVTAAQQKTARGGAVIGNSFKTIFTRIQRPEVLNQLERLGIAVRDLQGNTLPAIRILDGLSRTFDTLSDSQKSIISEQVAGVFQINILKAALSDLNSEYGIYQGALRAASSATNEAVQRNQELNTTTAALLNQTIQSFKELGSTIGAISLAPAMKDLLGGVNTVLVSLTEAAGTEIGQGILSGIGKFIGGPGLAIAGIIGGKLLFNFVKFSKEAFSTLMGQNNAAAQQKSLQQNIVALLSQQPNLLAQIQSGQMGANQVAQAYLNTLREQQRLQASIGSVAAGAARAAYAGGARTRGGTVRVPGFALATTPVRAGGGGMIPNFSNGFETMRPADLRRMAAGTRNLQNAAGAKAELARRGLPLESKTGSKNYKATGLTGKIGVLTGIGANTDRDLTVNLSSLTTKSPKVKKMMQNGLTSVTIPDVKYRTAFQESQKAQFSDLINNPTMQSAIGSIASNLSYQLFEPREASALQKVIKNRTSSVRLDAGAEGSIFEAASRMFLGTGKNPFSSLNQQAAFDFEEGKKPKKLFRSFFNFGEGLVRADSKRSSSGIASNIVNKTFNDSGTAALGYPNFSALSEAVAREKAAGIPSGAIRVGRSSQLVGPSNPQGLAVYNTIDEPRGLSQGINRYKSAGLNPKAAGMPNFAVSGGSTAGIPGMGGGSYVGVNLAKVAKAQEENTKAIKSNTAENKKSNKTFKERGRIGGIGTLGASFGLSMASGFIPQDTAGGRATSAFTESVATGAAFGPYGAAAGALVGTFRALAEYGDNAALMIQKNSKEREQALNNLTSAEAAASAKQNGEVEKSAAAYAQLNPETKALIGGFENLSAETVASAKNFIETRAAIKDLEAQSLKAGQAFSGGFKEDLADAVIMTVEGIATSFEFLKTQFTEIPSFLKTQFTEVVSFWKTKFDEFIARIITQLPDWMTGQTTKGQNTKSTYKPKPTTYGFSKGGLVTGGSGNRDDVPAMLTNGEFVVTESGVKAAGLDFLNKINSGGGGAMKLLSVPSAPARKNTFQVPPEVYIPQGTRNLPVMRRNVVSPLGNLPPVPQMDTLAGSGLLFGGGKKALRPTLASKGAPTPTQTTEENFIQKYYRELKEAAKKQKAERQAEFDVQRGSTLASTTIGGAQVSKILEGVDRKNQQQVLATLSKAAGANIADQKTAILIAQQLEDANDQVNKGYEKQAGLLKQASEAAKPFIQKQRDLLGLSKTLGSFGRSESSLQANRLGVSLLSPATAPKIGGGNLRSGSMKAADSAFAQLADLKTLGILDETTTSKLKQADGDIEKITQALQSAKVATEEEKEKVNELILAFAKLKQQNTVGGILGENFRFDTQDQFDFLMDSVDELSKEMKSSFKGAFGSFIDGSKSAKDAFKGFALTILDKLSDMSLNYATNSLFAAGAKIFGFARGGMVNGGSGVRDDVPAMLMGGEYVVKKSAVDALGVGFLNRINSYAEGGVVAANQFQKGTLGTRGSFNVGKGLSALSITSDLNPQNALRDQMAQEDEQRVQRYLEYQERKKQAMDAYKQGKRQRRIGGIISAATSLVAGGIAAKGGGGGGEPIEGPLMEDGSFYTPDTPFPLQVPTGRAQGGSMSTSIAPVKPLGTSSAPIPMSFSGGGSGGAAAMLAASIQQLSQSIQSGGGAAGGETVVNLTFNIDKSGEAKAEGGDNKKNPGEPSSTEDQKKEKEFGEMIKSVVLETITKQKRPGGLLFKAS